VKAKATKRAMATVPRVVSNNKGYGNGKKGCRQVTAMRATVAVRTVVGKDEGGGDDNVGSRQGRVWGWHGNGNGEKDGGQETATSTKRAVTMARRLVGKYEGDGKYRKINGDGHKEGNCKEEGTGEHWWHQDNIGRDKDNNYNNNCNTMANDDADDDDQDNGEDDKNDGAAAAVGVECSYFYIKTRFWVLLVVGEGQGRQAGS
jgi:hypothetical protein